MYFDAAYLVRLYVDDPGAEEVRALARSASTLPASLIHGRAEVIAAMHRCFREKRLGVLEMTELIHQFSDDWDFGLFTWLPLTSAIITRVKTMFLRAPSTLFLRAGDALHIACALEEGTERSTPTMADFSKPRGISVWKGKTSFRRVIGTTQSRD